MTFKERMTKLDKIGLNAGIPDIKNINNSGKESIEKNTAKGQKQARTYAKNIHHHEAKTGLKTGHNPTKKHGILGSTISLKESTVALLEQLLESSKAVLFEDESVRPISTMGGMAKGGNGVPPTKREQPSSPGYGRQVKQKTELNDRDSRRKADIAQDLKSGSGGMTARENIIGLTQTATNNYALGRRMGAENHAWLLNQREQQQGGQ